VRLPREQVRELGNSWVKWIIPELVKKVRHARANDIAKRWGFDLGISCLSGILFTKRWLTSNEFLRAELLHPRMNASEVKHLSGSNRDFVVFPVWFPLFGWKSNSGNYKKVGCKFRLCMAIPSVFRNRHKSPLKPKSKAAKGADEIDLSGRKRPSTAVWIGTKIENCARAAKICHEEELLKVTIEQDFLIGATNFKKAVWSVKSGSGFYQERLLESLIKKRMPFNCTNESDLFL